MRRTYKPLISGSISELIEFTSYLLLKSPTFIDKTGHFPEENIDTAFYELNESLRQLRVKLGEDRYIKLVDISNRMQAYFEADPEDTTGDTAKGCELIYEMRDLLKQRIRRR
jgi:hypothetical protein